VENDDNTQSFVPLTEGTEIGHYKIISKIGAGGMGEVYLAEDTKLNRKVALKFMPVHMAGNADMRARFTREAQAAAKLDHPNIVPVYEVGEHQGRPYFAMAHIDGKSLRDVIKEGKLGTDDAVSLTMQILEGLHKAHDAGVVHRDIKPGNIIIDKDGRARLVDFGLAMVSGEDKLTKTGSTLGTVGYMSPEQVEGKTCDHRSDLFSVGVILYEMLTGRRPFEGDNDAAIVKAITDSTPEPVARFKSGTTGELQQIVNKALSKDPAIRYQTAAGMLADLKRLQIGTPTRKSSKLIYWIAAAIIIIVGGYFGYTQFLKEKPQPDEPKRLVVLPFDNMGSEDQGYFANGITDEVINRLLPIQGLSVVARQSAERLKKAGADIHEIGKQLDAEFVLDATIRWQESSTGSRRVKLVTQLIKVSDESVVWGRTYDTVMTEVFTLQSEMAQQVAEHMGIELTPKEKEDIWARYTDFEDAWDYYLRGDDYLMRGAYGIRKDLRLAIDMYIKAIKIDSTFARAYSQMSKCYSRLYNYRIDRSDSIKVRAKETADKALALTRFRPHLSGAHGALSEYYLRVESDTKKGLEELKKAFDSEDRENNAYYLHRVTWIYQAMGEWDKCYESMAKAASLQRKSEVMQYDLGTVCEMMRKYEEAERCYLRAIELRPDWRNPYVRLQNMYLEWQGDTQKARDVIALSWDKVDTTLWQNRLIKLDILDGNLQSARERAADDDLFNISWICRLEGKPDSSMIFIDSLLKQLWPQFENMQDNPDWNSYFGILYAFKGDRDSAMIFARKATDIYPLDQYVTRGFGPLKALIDIHCTFHEYDSALVIMENLLNRNGESDLGLYLIDPDYTELRKELGFARLVRDYGNEYHKRLYREKVGKKWAVSNTLVRLYFGVS